MTWKRYWRIANTKGKLLRRGLYCAYFKRVTYLYFFPLLWIGYRIGKLLGINR